MNTTEKRNWSKEEIVNLLTKNDEMVRRSLLQLFNYQTEDEQVVEHTKYLNGRGFRACDAKKMSGVAKWLQDKGWLSPKQMKYVRRKLIRTYATQLTRIANGEQ